MRPLPTKSETVYIVETESLSELGRAYILSHVLLSISDKLILIPTYSNSVISHLCRTSEFLGIPHEVVSLRDAESLTEEICKIENVVLPKVYSCSDKPGPLLRDVYKQLFPKRYVDLCRGPSAAWFEVTRDQSAILCLSDQGLFTASQYGILTGRPLIYSDTANITQSLFSSIGAAKSIYVSPPADWTVDSLRSFLAVKRAAGNKSSLGFFYPFGGVERELFPLKSFLFARLKKSADLPYTFFYPLEGRSDSFTVDRANFVIGRGGSAEEAQEKLTKPAEYLFSTPHSNGVDMSLGDVVLCSRIDHDPSTFTPAKGMPCFYADVCSRKTTQNLLLSASSIKSVVVFLYTCWGVLLRNGVYDVEISLGKQFAGSPFTAALLTTYSLSLLDRAAGVYIAERYSRNEPLGKATAEFNDVHYARYNDQPDLVVLFGDPDFGAGECRPLRIVSSTSNHGELAGFVRATGLQFYEAAAETSAVSIEKVAKIPGKVFAALDYTRCAINATKLLELRSLTPLLDALSERTEGLWIFSMLFNSRLAQSRKVQFQTRIMLRKWSELITLFQNSWLEFYKVMTANLGGHVRLQVDRYFVEDRESRRDSEEYCPYCGTSLYRHTHRMAGTAKLERQLIECHACATIFDGFSECEDAVITCNCHWTIGGEQSISISLKTKGIKCGHYLAAAMLEPFIKRGLGQPISSSVQGFSNFAQGVLLLTLPPLSIDDTLTPGCYHLNVLVLIDASLLILRRKIYLQPEEA